MLILVPPPVRLSFNGSEGPFVKFELSSVQTFTPGDTKNVSAFLAPWVQSCGVASERYYLQFNGYTGDQWGWNGTTFEE